MDGERVGRLAMAVAVVLLVVAATLNAAAVLAGPPVSADSVTPGETTVAEPRANATVVTGHAGPDGGYLLAVHPNGTVWRYEDRRDGYFDVDPVPGTDAVLVAAVDELSAGECPASTACTRELLVRYDLATGTERVLYERYRPGTTNNEWHDVDHLGGDRYVVADMARDRVFAVDVSTGAVEWAWDPQSAFDVGTGGSNLLGAPGYPADWTHLNDVEALADGRVMVSMRNHDQVVFLDPETGVESDWTLGTDDEFGTLYEPHNPDYVPAERGGPAVVVADSHNDRVVEYRRVDGGWERSWGWRDDRLAWPRDADRLPNGHTLVTDTNGRRVVEVDRDGEVAWALTGVTGTYDAERLGTGEESAGGASAARLELAGTAPPRASADEPLAAQLAIARNAVRYGVPWWVGPLDAALAGGAGAAALTGAVLLRRRVTRPVRAWLARRR